MSNQKKYSAKGYYIALVLCAAALGVSGYLYYSNRSDKTADVPAAVTQQELQEAGVPERGHASGRAAGQADQEIAIFKEGA